MKVKFQIFFGFIFAILLSSQAFGEWAYVERVIDGDTFVASVRVEREVNGEVYVTRERTTIRVSEIDTPETKHPTKGVEPGGKEASQLAKSVLLGNRVWLEGNKTGKYGRRVSKVYLSNGTAYSEIVREHGYDKNAKKAHRSTTKSFSTKSRKKTYARSPRTATKTWINKSRSRGSRSSSYNSTPTYRSRSSSPSYSSNNSKKEVHVSGYYRKDGTYVKPHYRAAPKRRK